MLSGVIGVSIFLLIIVVGTYSAKGICNWRNRDYALSFVVILSLVGFFAPQFLIKHHYMSILMDKDIERKILIDDYMAVIAEEITSEEKQEKLANVRQNVDSYNTDIENLISKSEIWDFGASSKAESMLLTYTLDANEIIVLDYTKV